MSRFEPRNLSAEIAVDTAVDLGQAIRIPQSGTGGGGEYGAPITDYNRAFAITRVPPAFRMVYTVADDIFNKWFELLVEGKENKAESEEFDKDIQVELTRLAAKQELTKMSMFERAFGWSILAINFAGTDDHSTPFKIEENDTVPKIEQLLAFSPTQISSIKFDRSTKSKRYLFPESYYVMQPGATKRLNIHYSRTILYATRPRVDEIWKGSSVLDPCWDDIVVLRNVLWSMGQTMFRVGPGLADITFTGREKGKIEEFVNSGRFAALNARTYFAHNETESLEFKGVSGVALDPMNYYLPHLEQISMASGIPVAILRGAQAGALTGSEINQLEYWGKIAGWQSDYEPGIYDLINLMIRSFEDKRHLDKLNKFKFNWLAGVQLTERQKAEIDEIKARTLATRGTWHTVNEIRKEEDPDAEDLSPEIGDQLVGRSAAPPRQEGEEEFFVTQTSDGSNLVRKLRKNR